MSILEEAPDVPDRETYSAYLAVNGYADATIRNYTALFVRWVDWCVTEGVSPTLCAAGDVRAWSRTLHGSRSVLAQARGMIHHLCTMVEVEDTAGAVPLPRAPKRPLKALPPEAAGLLVAEAKRSGLAGTATLVGLYTAARRSEIAGMEWQHVGFDSITFYRPKMRDWHTIPLHPVLRIHLEDRRESGEQWLFPGRYGGHVSPAQVWKWVTSVAERAGVPNVTPHVLRHTALTMANDATRDLRAVMDFAGHTKPEVTAGYTRVGFERLTEAVASLNYGQDGGEDDR